MVKKPTLILLAILIILSGFAWWLNESPSAPTWNSTATPTSIPSPLADWKYENTRLIKFENSNGSSLSIRMGKDFNVWSIDEYPNIMADSSKVLQLISELTSIQPIAVLDSDINEQSMGLGENARTITLVDVSGATHEIQLGNATATGSGSYIKSGGSYYIISTPIIDNVSNLLTLDGIVKATEVPTTVSETPQP